MKRIVIWMAALLLLGANSFAGDKLNAYFYAPYMDTAAASAKLKAAGFDIVATYPTTDKSTTIVISNAALKAAASKEGRGFGAVLRVLVDGANNRISATNPVYFGKGFFQDDYDEALGKSLSGALKSALGELSPSKDTYSEDDLAEYHFMFGMPYYDDSYVLGKGDNAVLVGKLEGAAMVFKLPLGNGSTLVGYDLSAKTKGFVKTVGVQNAGVLPYTILVEDGKAKALNAKFYIAISYPMLTMGEFMKISDIPGDIEKELEAPFK